MWFWHAGAPLNLAIAELFMIGGYLLMQSLAWTKWYVLAVPLAFIASALVAIVLEVVVLRPLYRRLPRSFMVEDGKVTRTFGGLPPPLTRSERASK